MEDADVLSHDYSLDARGRRTAALREDGTRWDYGYNDRGEVTSATPPARKRLEFGYDGQGRRVRKTVYVQRLIDNTPTWTHQEVRRFVYDGWNLLAEFMADPHHPSTFILQHSYAWGYDLSGSEQGAGGVGGLVLVKPTSTTVNNSPPPQTSALAPAYDGNGNIHAYLDCTTGAMVQRMEYDAFGNELTLDSMLEGGPAPASTTREVPFQFSTKYTDSETSLSYYGYRYYSSEMGRWLNRDPIGERGGINLYGMVGNNALSNLDFLGLQNGRGGPGEAMRKCCEANKGIWRKYADVHFNGSIRECVKGLLSEPEVVIGGGSLAAYTSYEASVISGGLGATVGYGSASSLVISGLVLKCSSHSCYK